MAGSVVSLSHHQAKRLDLARRRRHDGHAAVEVDWVRTIADLAASGVSVKTIANHLFVSRQTVYDWLEKADQRP
jgi:DNA-binding NarL/FixJ family response regulator